LLVLLKLLVLLMALSTDGFDVARGYLRKDCNMAC